MRWLRVVIATPLLLGAAIIIAGCGGSESDPGQGASEGLALTEILTGAHAHSLMVDRGEPNRLWLGIHGGLYVSQDMGKAWTLADLEGADAMNLAQPATQGPFWVAGHEVLERSDDGGETWQSVRPDGLPGLDLHGFAIRPGRSSEITAAVAGQGLYRSTDAGKTFELASREVGPSVFGIAITPDGTVFAADPERGLLTSRDGGSSFRAKIEGAGLVSVAVAERRPGFVLAGGEPGIVVSTDGGESWKSAFDGVGVAAVAIDPSRPARAYAVGNDGRFYVTRDGARTWAAEG